jgi:hypothetical protein
MTGRLRMSSGLVLFAYVVTHLVNHSLGIVSLPWKQCWDGSTRYGPASWARLGSMARSWFTLRWHSSRCGSAARLNCDRSRRCNIYLASASHFLRQRMSPAPA